MKPALFAGVLSLSLSEGFAPLRAAQSPAAIRAGFLGRPLVPVAESADASAEREQLAAIVLQAERAMAAVRAAKPGDTEARALIQQATVEALEEFVSAHPESVWTPSLRTSLGAYYREEGRYTLAFEHWQRAWDATKLATQGPAKAVGDYALAHLARLLANFCHVEALALLLRESEARVLDRGPLSQMMRRTREGFAKMVRDPAACYRCGVAALHEVARALQRPYYHAKDVLPFPATGWGCSLTMLSQLAQRAGLGLQAVKRSEGQEILVPCVAHSVQNHYLAIIAEREGWYKVVDAGTAERRYLRGEALNAELTGYFLAPAGRLPAGWRVVDTSEAGTVWGRGYWYVMMDENDMRCPDDETCSCPIGASGPPGRGGPPGGGPPGGGGPPPPTPPVPSPPIKCFCAPCIGMPAWRVSEPYLNLWVEDVPLGYVPSHGPPVTLQLAWKQRDENAGGPPDCFSFGMGWNCSWFSYVWAQPSQGYQWVYLPGGGRCQFELNQEDLSGVYYYNRTQLHRLRDGQGQVTGFELLHADGSKEVYGYQHPTYLTSAYFLSARVDPQGRQIEFQYESSDDQPGVCLRRVVDADGNTTTLYYDDANAPYMVTRVVDPFDRTATLTYTTLGLLSGIEDVEQVQSSLTYDNHGWPTTLTTPYGTTAIACFDAGDLQSQVVDRYARITFPGGSKELYALVDNGTSIQGMPTAYPAGTIPQDTPLDTLDTVRPEHRNSFYWNRAQTPELSGEDPEQFTWSDYRRARIRHWLGYAGDLAHSPIDTISVERSPSADGTTDGPLTWYDYAGKDPDYPDGRGTQILPGVIARVMPDSSTWYTWYQRDDWGRVTQQVEKWTQNSTAHYRTNTFLYAANGMDLVARLFGPVGSGTNRVVSGLTYDANHPHLPVQETNALGEVTLLAYDAYHRLSTRTTPAGLLSTFTYGADGYVAAHVDSIAGTPLRTNLYTWQNGHLHTSTDDRGLARTFTYDGLGRLTRIDYPDSTWAGYAYTNGAGARLPDLTATRDRLGNWSRSAYNEFRQVVTTIDPLGRITGYAYCGCGAPEYVTNAYNTAVQLVTHYVHDFQGRRTHVYLPDGAAVTNTYDALGRLVVVSDGLGSTTNVYDNLGRQVEVWKPFGQAQALAYDVEDHPVEVTDANGVTVQSTHDALGRPLTRTYPDGGVETFGYTANVAALTGYTSQTTNVVLYAYDAAGRKTSETSGSALSGSFVPAMTNSFTYSPAGDLLTLLDGKNQTTTWAYTTEGQVSGKWDARGTNILSYAYDADGRLASRWSLGKGTTAYTYDAVGNLTLVDYPAGTADVTFAYDALNRPTSMLDGSGTNSYSYSYQRLLSEGGLWASDTVTYTYNTAGRRSGLSLAQPGGSVWTNGFLYDASARLTNVTSLAGSFGYLYDPTRATLPGKLTLPGGAYITNLFDSVARLTSTALKDSSGTLLNSHGYQHNLAGQRTRQTRTDASYVDYTYDALNELATAVGSGAQSTENLRYGYDTAQSMTKRTNGVTVTTYTINNALNQVSGDGTYTYTYDGNGNRTQRTVGNTWLSYSYDAENQLTGVSTDTYGTPTGSRWRSDYVYDGRGRLRKRIDYTWNTYPPGSWQVSGEIRYIYDGMRVIQERNSGNTPSVSYTRGNDLSGTSEGAGGIGGLLARSDQYNSGSWGRHALYHADGNGNITALMGTAQTLLAAYRFDPYGRSLYQSGTLANANTYRFSSKDYHPNPGLYYYGFRFYEPGIQRWINRDPMGEQGGRNLYRFARNSPMRFLDRWGLDFIEVPGGPNFLTGNPLHPVNCEQLEALIVELQTKMVADPELGALARAYLTQLLEIWNDFCNNDDDGCDTPPLHPAPAFDLSPVDVWHSRVNAPTWTPPWYQPKPGCVAGIVIVGGVLIWIECTLNPINGPLPP